MHLFLQRQKVSQKKTGAQEKTPHMFQVKFGTRLRARLPLCLVTAIERKTRHLGGDSRLIRVRPCARNGSVNAPSVYDGIMFFDRFYRKIGLLSIYMRWYMKRLNCVCKGAKLRRLEVGKPLKKQVFLPQILM